MYRAKTRRWVLPDRRVDFSEHSLQRAEAAVEIVAASAARPEAEAVAAAAVGAAVVASLASGPLTLPCSTLIRCLPLPKRVHTFIVRMMGHDLSPGRTWGVNRPASEAEDAEVQVATKAITSAVLNAAGDALSQKYCEGSSSIDWKRLGTFTFLVRF